MGRHRLGLSLPLRGGSLALAEAPPPMLPPAADSQPLPAPPPPEPQRGEQLTLWLAMLLPLGFALLCGLHLLDLRRDAWARAEQQAQNLLLVAGRDILRQVDLYDRVIQAVADSLVPAGPAAEPATPPAWIFAPAAATTHLGTLLVMDASGEVTASSDPATAPRRDFSGQDFFLRHLADPRAGLFVSRPFPDRYQQDYLIALSRRIPSADGSFAGVVVGTLRLSYLRELLGGMQLGRGSTMNLFLADGTLIYRTPLGSALPGLDLSQAANVQRFIAERQGSFVATAIIDEVERLYSFTHLGDRPLILNAAIATSALLTGWREHALWVALAAGLLGLAMLGLMLRLRQELRLRRLAEAAARAAGERCEALSETDGLTGLGNRRQLDRMLALEWARLQRHGAPLALVLLDLDHFKAFNDSQGHPAGDAVLRSLADCIRAASRPDSDFAARYGGAEFAVLLPETGLEAALRTAQRIRSQLQRLDLPHPAAEGGRVTVSLGVAALVPAPGSASDSLLRAAAAALDDAKLQGRDRVAAAA